MKLWKYIETQASILQLENYEAGRWWQWWKHHPTTILEKQRKPVKWTKRMIATLVVTPWVMSGISHVHEDALKQEISKLLSRRTLKKIAITGSYGKTSVKKFLYTILDTAGYALTTPGSFNTLGGIERVLKQELTDKHEFFVVELGAYHRGDIKSLAEVIQPDFGILTAIGPQHLERFGSLENIKQAKFELMDCCPKGKFLVNWNDDNIREYAKQHDLEDSLLKFSCQNIQFDDKGLLVSVNNVEYRVPRLFGTVMAENVGLAIAAAVELGISAADIQKGLQFIYPPEHRLELSKLNRATIVDDTYSSNVRGFEQMIADMKLMTGKKALVTPGVVELGNEEVGVHERLGKSLSVFDNVVGVGETARTKALGVDSVIPLDTKKYWQTVTELSKEYDWIVLENDITEQYA